MLSCGVSPRFDNCSPTVCVPRRSLHGRRRGVVNDVEMLPRSYMRRPMSTHFIVGQAWRGASWRDSPVTPPADVVRKVWSVLLAQANEGPGNDEQSSQSHQFAHPPRLQGESPMTPLNPITLVGEMKQHLGGIDLVTKVYSSQSSGEETTDSIIRLKLTVCSWLVLLFWVGGRLVVKMA